MDLDERKRQHQGGHQRGGSDTKSQETDVDKGQGQGNNGEGHKTDAVLYEKDKGAFVVHVQAL